MLLAVALAGLSFDEALTGAGEMEDVDIARRLVGRTRIRYEPKAVVYHRPSAQAREPESVRLGRLVRHHRHLLLKHRRGSFWQTLAFWWSVVGLFVVCLVSGRWASARAVAAAGLEAAGRERKV
jgi:GT2 family glycosyltransferase